MKPRRLAPLLLLACLLPAPAAERPNFLFFLVDDLGWADVGFNGSTFHETPHIDALADSGMRFNHGYAACPVCSPTRASILTGRHPVRVDITDWIPGRKSRPEENPRYQHVDDRAELALEEVTLAEVLREAGYQTFFAGKWHLGGEGHLPTDQGFDINIGGFHVGSPPGGYYGPWKNPYLEAKAKGEYLTERLTEESVAFLENRKKEAPFLLYLSYYNVHTPIQAYQKRFEEFESKLISTSDAPDPVEERQFVSRPRQDNPAYASMVAAVDDSVGALLGALEELDLAENTVVCFFADNGGLCTKPAPGPTSNLPLRSGKGWLYEGGVREPTIIRAPGVTAPGSASDRPMVSMDFFPTFLELAGLPLRPDLHADGESLVATLKGTPPATTRDLFWHYPHYHGSGWTPGASVRRGDWKLIEFHEYGETELYHLGEDPGEQRNLAASNPEKVEELRKALAEWQGGMGASTLQPHPAWDPEGGYRFGVKRKR